MLMSVPLRARPPLALRAMDVSDRELAMAVLTGRIAEMDTDIEHRQHRRAELVQQLMSLKADTWARRKPRPTRHPR